jgi:hypothetical protein
MTGTRSVQRRNSGAVILLVAAALALAIAIFNDVWSGNGIHGTAGALLVVISSALMFAAAAALVFAGGMGRRLRGTLLALIALDILGTALAAYMLEADWLIAAMGVAAIGWLVRLIFDQPPRPFQGNTLAQRGAQ